MYMSDRLMREHNLPEADREIVERAGWRVWRTTRDKRLVTDVKRLANLEKGKLLRRKTKLRGKLIPLFQVRMPLWTILQLKHGLFAIVLQDFMFEKGTLRAVAHARGQGDGIDGVTGTVTKAFYDKWLSVSVSQPWSG
jgi:hypothetical protein